MNYIIGAGGHATVINDIASRNVIKFDGVFCDASSYNITDLKWIDKFDKINDYSGNFILGFGDVNARAELVKKLDNKKIKWMILIDPSAVIGSNVTIGEGTVIMPNVVINSGAKIGKHVIINSGAIIEHGCVIGDYTHVAPRSVICGNTHVGSKSWIGAGATVINAIEIGKNVIVGAGTVIIRNVDDNSKIVGNPGHKINE